MPPAMECPDCGTRITERHEHSWCTKCGQPLPKHITESLPRLVELATKIAEHSGTDSRPQVPGSISPVVDRYRDGYRVGASIVALGSVIKIIGYLLAGTITLVSWSASSGPLGGGTVILGLFFAAVVGIVCWVCGVIVSAQGQILQAALDTAVVGSPFLNHHERAEAMGLPRSVVDRVF